MRAAVVGLSEELAASRAAQAELGGSLRLLAPFRRGQERVRLRAQAMEDHLPRWGRPFSDAGAAGQGHRAPDHGLDPSPRATIDDLRGLPPEFIGRHPLLARTLAWGMDGAVLPSEQQQPLREGRAGRVLVIVHVYYPDLWPMLAERIERIPAPTDLVVTLAEGPAEAAAEQVVAQFPEATIVHVPNRGRDMAPLVRVLDLGLVGDHDAVLKLHTKRSLHRIDGDEWRDRLLDSLCGSPDRTGLILALLRSSGDVGMVAGSGSALGHRFWGANGPLVAALGVRSGIEVDPRQVRFPGGSMFWSRTGPLNALRSARLTLEDFEHEVLTIDGTTAHALERFVGVSAAHAGQRVIPADEVAGELALVSASDRRHSP